MANKYPDPYKVSGAMKLLYNKWQQMHIRCRPDGRKAEFYKRRYYDRGIRVCDEWNWWPTFAEWAAGNGYKKGLEIDRRDNDKGYSPSNCRFVTKLEQNRNRDMKLVAESIRAAHTARMGKLFECVETGERFMTQISAERETGVDRKGIRHALRGKYSQAGGFHWRYINSEAPVDSARAY